MTDLDRWRADTPGCLHRIHLNNAGAALSPTPVTEAIERHLALESAIGGYEAHEAADAEIRATYGTVARLIGAQPHQVAVVENATVAVAQALSAFDFRPGDVIVTSQADYPSNQLMYLSLARRQGVEVRRAANLPEGGVDPDSVRDLARDPRCRVVALTWVPTNSGLVQDVEAVGAVCAELDVPYIVDACQVVGQLPIDVQRLRCDFLGATARKFLRGPRGIGFLYVSERQLARGAYPLYVDMRGAEWTSADTYELAVGARRFENWEFPYALVLGMGAAARYALGVGDATYTRPSALAATLREALAAVPGVRVTDSGRHRCAIVTAAVARRDPEAIKLALRERGVNVWVSDPEDGVLDMEARGVSRMLRISPHYYNTEQELTTAVDALAEILS
jgi:selenocysteine lyase/cysteine desulfurase